MLVWEDDENIIHVSYNGPMFIASRHRIRDSDEMLTTIAGALDNLSNVAITN